MKCTTCKQFCKTAEDGLCERCRKLAELEARMQNETSKIMVQMKDIDIPDLVIPSAFLDSIRTYGIKNTPILKENPPGSPFKYKIVDGRRRLSSWKQLKHDSVEVYEETTTNDTRMLSLGLNFWRSPNPVMDARILKEFIDEGMNQTAITNTLGISQGQISKRLSLLSLLPGLLQQVENGTLAANVGYMLAKLSEKEQQKYLDSGEHITIKDLEEVKRQEVVANLDMFAIENTKTMNGNVSTTGTMTENEPFKTYPHKDYRAWVEKDKKEFIIKDSDGRIRYRGHNKEMAEEMAENMMKFWPHFSLGVTWEEGIEPNIFLYQLNSKVPANKDVFRIASGPTVPELIHPGDIIKLHNVHELSKQYRVETITGPYGEVSEKSELPISIPPHYSISMSDPDAERNKDGSLPKNYDYAYMNCLVAQDGKINALAEDFGQKNIIEVIERIYETGKPGWVCKPCNLTTYEDKCPDCGASRPDKAIVDIEMNRYIGEIDASEYQIPLSQKDMAEHKGFIGKIGELNRTRNHCPVCTGENCETCQIQHPSGFFPHHDGLSKSHLARIKSTKKLIQEACMCKQLQETPTPVPVPSPKENGKAKKPIKHLPAKEGFEIKALCQVKMQGEPDSQAWEEDIQTKDAQTIPDIYVEFNNNLRGHDHPRELVKILSEDYVKVHRWSEKLNLVGLKDKKGIYDKYQCLDCGLEYRRRTLDWRPPLACYDPCKPKKGKGA
ncbi:ParB/RepB/Spo0J family partition protein [Sulfuricurvum sp.]|uniref:ParB/RepB/Spo0J family partition protein n=1 Tax=Sulfuricurvum sp. TaxID=2025608 RepID=UPI00356418CA